jgi:parvulin-like peptidyl-prolyl isomerase
MKNFIFLLFIIVFTNFNIVFATQIKAVFFLKNQFITSEDLVSRQNLQNTLLSLSKDNLLDIPLLPKSINIKDQLKKELIIRNSAEQYAIDVTEEDITRQADAIFSKYNISYKDLKNKIFKKNSNLIREYKNYISSYLLWMKIVREKIVPSIEINYSDLEELAIINDIKTKTTQIKLYEIYLKDEVIKDKAINKIDDLYDFKNFAKKFSQSPSATSKGLLGWINSSDLNNATSSLVKNLKIGELSKAKESQDGYYLYMIESKKVINFIEPKIKKIIHNALLERKIMSYILQFFAKEKKN